MCNGSGKVIAWLDHELPRDESAHVEQHIRSCPECRVCLEAYQRASRGFEAYCDAVVASSRRGRLPHWVPVVSGAVAAVVTLLLFFPHARVVQDPGSPVETAAPSVIALRTVPTPIKRTRTRHSVAPVPSQDVNWAPAEPNVEIAIPAEAIFPPGAIPEGVNFGADVSIGADGSAQRLRLRPRLVEFERRTTQP
jgi:hypothetical protein